MPTNGAPPDRKDPQDDDRGATTTAGDAARPRRARRWLRRLAILALALLLLSVLATWLLQPERLVPLLLDRAGRALGLEITADPGAELRLRGEPQLVVRHLVVREPGAATTILRAGRVLLALPWSSIRDRGRDLALKRIELDAPTLDLPALQAWLARRPRGGQTTIPTLTDGLRVIDGRIVDGGWRIEALDLRVPALHPDRPLRARVRGRYVDATTRAPFDLALAASRPANDAGVAVVGTLAVERDEWRLPAALTVSGRLHLDTAGEAFAARITPLALGVSARYESGDTRLPFALGLHGPLRVRGGALRLAPAGMALRGADPVPVLDAHGALGLGPALDIELDGALPRWPEAWPALPAPLSASASPLPFALRYAGASDLSDVAALHVARDATTFDGRFRLFEVLDWLDRVGGSPLPPLDGRLRSPRLDLSGATIEGIDLTLDDGGVDGVPDAGSRPYSGAGDRGTP